MHCGRVAQHRSQNEHTWWVNRACVQTYSFAVQRVCRIRVHQQLWEEGFKHVQQFIPVDCTFHATSRGRGRGREKKNQSQPLADRHELSKRKVQHDTYTETPSDSQCEIYTQRDSCSETCTACYCEQANRSAVKVHASRLTLGTKFGL